MHPQTVAVIFPFDLFGSSGTAAGACLLGDALREMVADSRSETRPARALAYRDNLKLRESPFETIEQLQLWRGKGRQIARRVLGRGEFLLWLGGNHLSILPVYEELSADTVVVQLDAHLDIYNLSDSTSTLSHGNFLLHAQQPLPAVINVGHRDLFLPKEHVQNHYHKTLPAAEVLMGQESAIRNIQTSLRPYKRVFLDIDCDVFDPAFFPATSTPLPFGLAPGFVLFLLRMIGREKLCGMSLSEFQPSRDRDDRSLGTLIWLIEWLLLHRYEEE